MGKALGPIFYHCLEQELPPLTSIVVRKSTGQPGSGFFTGDYQDLDAEQRATLRFDWTKVTNPFGAFGPKDTTESFAERLLAGPDEALEVYTRVKARGRVQEIFRRALLQAYGSACALCGLSFEEALEAAHIVPWSVATPEERVSPSNGILMCANHHRLFDASWILIRPDYEICYPYSLEELGSRSGPDWRIAGGVNMRKLVVPDDPRLQPDASLLARRMSNAS